MVVAKNAYLTQAEMEENASVIYYYLTANGWSRSSIAAMLGNMQTESTINPGIWQSLTVNPVLGYGLVQWTPATKYINWATSEGYNILDIYGQLDRLQWEIDNGQQWIRTNAYPLSFQEFKESDESPEYLAQAFLRNYERPANQNQPKRSKQARWWFDWFDSIDQVAIHPFDFILISQGEDGQYSHKGTLCIDYVGKTTRYPYYAPAEMRLIMQQDAGAVRVWKTEREVLCADGVLRHFFMSCIHDDIDWIPQSMVGDFVIPQGNVLGYTGVAGNATGDHAHIQVMNGEDYQGFFTNADGSISLVGEELHQYNVFFINKNAEIINDFGYPWKFYNGNPPKPPKPMKSNALIQLWRGGVIKL